MGRMIILCILFLSSSMALTAAPYKTAKYKQLLKTIKLLETSVKVKDVELLHTPENPVDGCIFTAVTCFQKGTLKLQPENSQVNSTFIQTIKILKRFSFSDPGKVRFPHNAHNPDHCSLSSLTDTTCNGGTVESKLGRKSYVSFITLEIKNVQFSALLEEAFILILSVNCTYVLGSHMMCQTKGQGLLQKMSDMILFIFQPCESSCESYEKKNPKEFLTSFAKLIKKVITVESSWVLFDILQTNRGILLYIISDNALFLQLFKD
ncbi:uncharacterized protein LOC133212345 [Neopsephotus bourkii]|uniref:uncharacterized protein LOC133212345 n=1 Tax=Neopsephotus bourkii TaxID=309878 RepID=UPI002AA59CC4|nr:uncharacterized protein LOC133212345 [Neopsephotus bourkii]